MRQRYVFRDGDWREPHGNGAPMEIPERDGVCVPMAIIRDFEPYQSRVVPGMRVGGRSARREEIARAADKGLVPFERIDKRPPGYLNRKYQHFAKPEANEAAADWAKNKRKAQSVKTDSKGALIVE